MKKVTIFLANGKQETWTILSHAPISSVLRYYLPTDIIRFTVCAY